MITFLLKNWKLSLIAILLLIISGTGLYIGSLKKDISVITSEKNLIKAQLDISQASVVSLKNSVEEQNSAIQKLKNDAEERQKKHQQELLRAKETSNRYKKQAEDLIKRRPPPNVPICKAADDLINEEIKNDKK